MTGEDYEIEGEEPEAQPKRRRFRALAVLIALFVVGAFGGVVWYAYSEGPSSKGGAVAPILKAEEGPTKVKPSQPGGMTVPNQDKLVLNNMQQPTGAQGTGQVERLLAPPETPVPRPVPPAPAAAPPASPQAAAGGAPTPIPPPPPAVISVPATPAPATVPSAAAAPPPSSAAPAPAASLPPPPPAPPPVTASGSAPPAAAKASAPAAAQAAKPQTAALAPGSGEYRVQLGSVQSADAANKEWERLKRTVPEVAPMQLTVVRADLGGEKGVFFRIQAGPLSGENAKLLCEALKTRNQGCLVVKP
ncbi:MAG: SPOR domain-containing protein [Proteobacteria bacterium]|nr:SPOR domain-containing protein [Pseudomonadota bacterium]MBI3496005.1 SPOR domain-containing protein [Pseudomonadota bacterium]